MDPKEVVKNSCNINILHTCSFSSKLRIPCCMWKKKIISYTIFFQKNDCNNDIGTLTLNLKIVFIIKMLKC